MSEEAIEKEKLNMMVSRTYKWCIENFSKESLKHEPLESNIFVYEFEDDADDGIDRSMWILKLYPDGCDNDSKGYICIDVMQSDEDDELDFQVDCKLSILKPNNNETNSQYATLHFDNDDFLTRRLFRKYIKLDYVLKSSNGLLYNDKLTLLFSIQVQKGPNFVSLEEPTYKSRLQLSEDFESFYNSKKFNDFTFIVGDKEIQANKSILAARSPLFFSMFIVGMKEKAENNVIIDDVDPKVFKEMLKFIYTGKLQNDQYIKELFVVADKYGVEGLKEVCESSLSNAIRIKNAMEILQLADVHHASDLKEQVMQFIVDHVSDVIETDGFKNIEHSQVHLLKEMFCLLAKKYRFFDFKSTQTSLVNRLQNEIRKLQSQSVRPY